MHRASVELDHLVVAAATLAEGIDHIATLTGVAPVAGGRHALMGTHNALLKLGERTYLEVIAIDPDAAKPLRRRWFGLDDAALQAQLAAHPRLVAWVARTGDIDAAAQLAPDARVLEMARGDYRWRIAVPDDGSRPAGGVLPVLIQWDALGHPAEQLPRSGVTLAQLAAMAPDPAPLRRILQELGSEGTPQITYNPTFRLAAMLRTPRGMVTL